MVNDPSTRINFQRRATAFPPYMSKVRESLTRIADLSDESLHESEPNKSEDLVPFYQPKSKEWQLGKKEAQLMTVVKSKNPQLLALEGLKFSNSRVLDQRESILA